MGTFLIGIVSLSLPNQGQLVIKGAKHLILSLFSVQYFSSSFTCYFFESVKNPAVWIMHDIDAVYSPLITIVLSLIIDDDCYQQSRGENAEEGAGNPFSPELSSEPVSTCLTFSVSAQE